MLAATGLGAETIPIDVPLRSKPVEFATEIIPILRAHCLACHHEKKAEASLVLETPQSILKGGERGPAVVPGNALASLLLKAAAHQHDLAMPPPDNIVGAKPLTPAQLGLFKLWIDQGATGSVATAREVRFQSPPDGFQPALATAVTPDGEFAVCSRGNRLFVYHLPTRRLAATLSDPGLSDVTNPSAPGAAHLDFVRSLAFDPSGELLASGGFREVKLWRRPRVTLAAKWSHDAAVRCAAVSVDGRWAATGDENGRIRIWEISSGKPMHSIAAHQAAVTDVTFSAAGAVLFSCSLDKSLRAWNLTKGDTIRNGVETTAPLHSLTLIHQDEWLVAGDGTGAARVWEIKGLLDPAGPTQPLLEIKAHEQAISAVRGLPGHEKEFLTGGADGLIRRFDAQSGKRLSELKNDAPVIALAASSDGRRIASAAAGYVRLWSHDGKQLAQFSGDPRLAAKIARTDAEIAFMKSAIALAQQDLKSYEGLIRAATTRAEDVKKAEEELAKVQKTRDEKKAAAEKAKAENNKVEAAEKAAADAEIAVTVAETVIQRAKAVSDRTAQRLAEAEQAVAARQELLKQQEAAKETAVTAAKAAVPAIRSLAFSADGSRLAVGCEDGAIHFLDAEAATPSQSQAEHQAAVSAIIFVADGTLVSVSADQQAIVWNAPSQWRLMRTIGGLHQPEVLVDRVLALDFSPDGQQLATGGGVPSASGELKIFSVVDGQLVREIKSAHSETICTVRFSPDGKYLASGAGDRLAKVFDCHTVDLVRQLAGHTGHVLALSWKADGTMLVSGGADKVLKLWDFETGLPVRTMKGTTYQIGTYKREVTAVSFVGSSEQILAASGDGTVRLHRTSSDNDVLTFSGAKGYQYSAAVTPDGQAVIASGADGTLRLWSGQDPKPRQSFAP